MATKKSLKFKKRKVEDKKESNSKTIFENFHRFKKSPMMRFKGNFFGGGFALSKNKVKAVIDNLALCGEFAAGKFDEQIMKLEDGEVLEL